MSTGDVITWEWTFEGGMPGTSSFQNPSVMYATAGIYDVTLTVSDGTDTHTLTMENYITVNVCTGLTDPALTGLNIYPNPGNGIFTINMSRSQGDSEVKVINPVGNVVYQESVTGNSFSIDLSNLGQGVYFMLIKNADRNHIEKIVIEQ
jgi:PKD repeat protein